MSKKGGQHSRSQPSSMAQRNDNSRGCTTVHPEIWKDKGVHTLRVIIGPDVGYTKPKGEKVIGFRAQGIPVVNGEVLREDRDRINKRLIEKLQQAGISPSEVSPINGWKLNGIAHAVPNDRPQAS